ncbi:hypothetical protein JW935_20580 [candidate division KSB1 bacterium]|nr:hypothetical protein [candidate division KSB1 bacterium]
MYKVLFLIFFTSIACAQDFQIDSAMLNESAGGARAAAMGRAFTALANDATALHWNPAGLVDFNKNFGVISGMLNFGNLGLYPDTEFSLLPNYQGRYSGGFSLNYVGFTIPILDAPNTLVGSIVIRNLSDLNQSFTIVEQYGSSENRQKFSRTGGIYALSTGAGMLLLPNLRIGTTFNFITGQQVKEESHEDRFGASVTRDWRKWQNKFSGFSMDVGFIWNPIKPVAVGSKFTLPHAIHFSDIEFKNSENVSRRYDIDASLEKPFSFSSGIGLFLARNFLFSFDYVVRPWKGIITHIDGQKNDNLFENANSFHMGVEYTVETENYNMPWRFGFFTNPVQLYEYDSTVPDHLGDQVIAHFLTGGFGITTKHFLFDVAFDYQMLQYKTLLNGQSSPIPLPIDYHLSRFTVIFGLGFYL